MRPLSIFLLLIFAVSATNAFGQGTVDLYSRVTDPRGIARFDTPDTTRTKSINFHGDARWNMGPDNIPTVASDTGSGIITHIWSALGGPDTSVTLFLYIDDTLVITNYYNEFFATLHGLFRPPLDIFANNANVWDVQIPYHHGFRIAMQSSQGNQYFAVEWHWVPESTLPWVSFDPAAAIPSTQASAESRYLSLASPWNDANADTIFRSDILAPQTAVTLADIDGPAMLECIRFIPSSYDFASLDSTWLNIYWDRSLTPSVHVPLKDFFLSPVNVTQVRALQLRADRDSGFISYFPMPFAVHARVELERTGSTPLGIASSFQYHSEPIDRNVYGYFHADFNESNPTKYHVWHPVIHTVGRGRYIGMSWGIIGHPFQVYLEGDPGFKVDSDATHYIEFTGAEDYFNSAWWFSQGPFTNAFAGNTNYVDQLYRFQYMDCYEFTKSFDFEFQPGNAADLYDHFRTVGYYYKHWTQFWASRDTLVSGETWTVYGSGYGPNQALQIALGSENLSAITSDSGDFSLSLQVPASWTPGVYQLSVNGESAPEKYYVYRSPAIRPLVDTLPITLRAGDSLWVKGTGFQSGETVNFYLDSISLQQSTITDSNNEFVTMLRIPYISEHSYLLVARGTTSGDATAQDLVTITRTVDVEFEDLMPPTFMTKGQCWAEDVTYFWEATWSKQMFVYFEPDPSATTGAAVEFQFIVAHPDTFDISYHGNMGDSLGTYNVSIDGGQVGAIDGYSDNQQWGGLPLPTGPLPLGVHYLSNGSHLIRFSCTGKNNSAVSYHVDPDCLVLRPTTYMAPTPGTLFSQVKDGAPQPQTRSLQIYPNPVVSGTGSIALTLAGSDATFFSSRVNVQAFDILGREIPAQLEGSLIDNSLTGTLSLPNALPGTYFIKLTLASSDGSLLTLPIQTVVVE